ncbi:MAG: DUF3127 domain-containing protein [Candidatus Shikimatogenerans sp. JK-2022]|nr:DUF3127 domain-containing protein [Candidatus Shikimatogenerans bostrichidophilus]
MYIIGRVKNILNEQNFKNNFKKKSIILITDEQYPQNLVIDFVQNKIELLDFIKINDKVKIFINLKGREWINKDGETKYFNSIQAWKIEQIKNQNIYKKSDYNDDLINNEDNINYNDINDEENEENDKFNDDDDDDDNDNDDDDDDDYDNEDDEYNDDEDDDDENDYDNDDDDNKKNKKKKNKKNKKK